MARPRRHERPSLFLSYPPPRPSPPPTTSPFVSFISSRPGPTTSIRLASPSSPSTLSLSPPPRVSFFLRSHPLVPSHFRTRGSSTFGKRVPSNPVFPHLLILAAPPSATSSSRFPPNRSPFLFSLLFRRFGFAHRESCKFIPRNLTSKEPPKDLTVSGSLDSFDVRPFPNTIDLRAPVSTLLDRISKYP